MGNYCRSRGGEPTCRRLTVQGGCGQLEVAVDHDQADISYAVRVVTRHSHNPTDRHWKTILEIVASVHGTVGLGLSFVRSSGLDLTAYNDIGNADKSSVRYRGR